MPAKASSVVVEGQWRKTWIPACAGKTEGEGECQSMLLESVGFEPREFNCRTAPPGSVAN